MLLKLWKTKREISSKIKKAKLRYSGDKIEAELGSNNLREASNTMKAMTGSNDKGNSNIALDGFDSDKQQADELNAFYLDLIIMTSLIH